MGGGLSRASVGPLVTALSEASPQHSTDHAGLTAAAMVQPEAPDEEDSQYSFDDFHADDINGLEHDTQAVPELDSNKTHVSAIQPHPDLDDDELEYVRDAPASDDISKQQTTAHVHTEPVATGKLLTRPLVDSAPINQGFRFGTPPDPKKLASKETSGRDKPIQEGASRVAGIALQPKSNRDHMPYRRDVTFKEPAVATTTKPKLAYNVGHDHGLEFQRNVQGPPEEPGRRYPGNKPEIGPPNIKELKVSTLMNTDNILNLTPALRQCGSELSPLATEGPVKVTERLMASTNQNERSFAPPEPMGREDRAQQLPSPEPAKKQAPPKTPFVAQDSVQEGVKAQKIDMQRLSTLQASLTQETPVAQRPLRHTTNDKSPQIPSKTTKVSKRKKVTVQALPPEDTNQCQPLQPPAVETTGRPATPLQDDAYREPNQEDILNVLVYTMQREKSERDAERARHEARNAELSQTRGAHDRLRNQLEVLQKQDKAQKEEIVKHERALPIWHDKIKKLEDMVGELIADRHQMKEELVTLNSKSQELIADREVMIKEINQTADAVGRFQNRCRVLLTEMHSNIVRAREIEEIYETFMQDHTSLLDEQRQRNDTIEGDLAQLTKSERQAHSMNKDNISSLAEMLERLLDKPEPDISGQLEQQFESLAALISRGVLEIEAFRSRPAIAPIEFARMDKAFHQHANALCSGINTNQQSIRSLEVELGQLREGVCSDMTRLTEQLKAEQGLASELADLRVAKANTDQALMNLQTHLEHKSRKVTELEGIINKLEKEHSAMSEEAQLLRSRPRQNPELLTQIVDLQSRKSSLEREVMQAQGIANQQKLTIENYEKEKNQLQARSESLQSRLQSSESRCIEVEKQQTEFDQKLEAQVGKIRTQLTQATNEDKSRWHSKCMGAMHDAQSKSTLLEGKITQLDQELANVRGNNSNQAAQAERLNKELTNAKAELEHERETAHRDAELIKQLQQEKSTRAESHKKDIEQFQRRLTEQSNLRVEAEEKLEQQRNGMKAQEQECLNLIEDRLHALECGDNECPSGILHTMSLDIIMALRDLIARESSSKDKFIAMHKAQLVKAHAQLGDIDEQFDEDGDSLDFAEDNHDASRELEPTTKESQELPYNGAAQQASGRSSTQEESQELPYMGDASRVSRNSNYTPMRGLMQRDHRSSFERNGEDQGDTPGHGTGKTLQDANHYVEESQYSRRVWHGQASDVAVAPLTAGTLNQLNPISFKGQAEGLKRIEEATSPVGDTQGLFPLTPMPRDTPHSGSSVRSQGTAPRANTGKVLNNNQGPAHRSANDAAKTPNRPLQVLDTNRMVPTSPAGIPIGRDPPNIKSARPRRLKNSVQNGSVGTQGNKFKSGKANADEKGGSAEMQPPQTDPGPVSNSQLIASLKRKSLGTDPITDSSNTSKSRRRKVETEDLGPVIGTSTSPGVSSSGKTGHGQARKSMRRKSQDKFSKRFQEDTGA